MHKHQLFSKFPDFYTPREEWANGVTHGMGLLLSMIGVVLLAKANWSSHANARQITGMVIYGMSALTLFSTSTLYHRATQPRLKWRLRRMDHAAIFVKIAGTITPFLLIGTRTTWALALLLLIWLVALCGAIFKTLVHHMDRFEHISLTSYIILGALGLLAAPEFVNALPNNGFNWLVGGGVVYLVGVIFYLWNRLPYNHAVWHLFVVVGSICHFFAVVTLLPA